MHIQEAVDRVAFTGQSEVALHTRGRHGGLAEGIVVEPTGMVLVPAADMVRGVIHASRVLMPIWTPVAIFGSLGVCIYVPASRHWLISYSPIHLT